MKFAKKSDIVIILTLIIVSVAGFIIYNQVFGERAAAAEIYYRTELVMTVDLTQGVEKTLVIPQNDHVVLKLHANGAISFIQSDCPDKICINSGKLDTVGQSAACLPNGIIVKIVPKGKRGSDDIDVVI